MKALPLILCLFLLLFPALVQASTCYLYTTFVECNISALDVIFGEGINGTAYIISTNKTWTEINVTGTFTETYYEYTLNVTNLSNSINYTVKLESISIDGISRLTNFTAYFHDGTTSKQIEIYNGSVTQPSSPWYSITTSATIYISLAIKVSSSGVSTADLRLHAVASGTTSPETIQTIRINVD